MMNSESRKNPGWQHSPARHALVLGLGALGLMSAGLAQAGCGMYSAATAGHGGWKPEPPGGPELPSIFEGIVGLWKFTMTSDGTSYPVVIPATALIDFGTSQWHPDGTEIMVSGNRAPSSGDVCMGVWKQTGAYTYQLKHIALAWASSDTMPSAVPAAYVGPATVAETITLNKAGTRFTGTFTIDQYASDGTTLIQHIAGPITGTRVTVD